MWTLANLPCELPQVTVPEFVDVKALAEHFRVKLENLTEESFVSKAIWRDLFALTGSLRTFYTSKSVSVAWLSTGSTNIPSNFTIDGTPRIIRAGPSSWVEIAFKFETRGVPATECYGFLSVVPTTEGTWKIWILRTILEELKDEPSVDHLEPSESAHTSSPTTHGLKMTNGYIDAHGHIEATTPIDKNEFYDCAIIGGGQSGLSVAGRLKALGIPYVILEKHEQVGDNWKTRYDSTKLHTLREFAHLPFEKTFPSSYREFLTKDDLAEGYQRWANKYGINIWLSSILVQGEWNDRESTWTLRILRNREEVFLRCSFVVFAVGGNSQFPSFPSYANKEAFQGQILHSAEYKNARAWKGKHGIVVGTANTAHDVAEDMLSAGLESVTMIQRSKTYVIPQEHYIQTQKVYYNNSIPTDVADRMNFSGPAALGRIISSRFLHAKAAVESERFDALERAGFLLDRTGDLMYYLLERFGGHYMDVGTSAKIANGQIKIKSDSVPIRYVENGLECVNGDYIRADVIVFCTGFLGNLRVIVQDLFGIDVASQVDDFWGLDEEGELKGAFKFSGHPAFFYHGGAVGQSRYMSRFIALQIKAKIRGTPLPLYTSTPPRSNFDHN